MVSMVECSPPAGLPATEVAPPPNFEVAPSWWRCPGKTQLPYSDPLIQVLPHLSKHLKGNYWSGATPKLWSGAIQALLWENSVALFWSSDSGFATSIWTSKREFRGRYWSGATPKVSTDACMVALPWENSIVLFWSRLWHIWQMFSKS